MIFSRQFGKANVTSLVERVSRYTVLLKNADRTSKPVISQIITALQPLPALARRGITFDCGTEFSSWRALESGIGAQSYFCNPHSPCRMFKGRKGRWRTQTGG